MDFARRFVNADNEWSNRSLAQLSLQYSYSDLYAATDGFHEKNKIGSGSYGQIYKGLMNDGTEVAIKVIDLPAEAGFEDEVRVLSKFRHPNLVILMGFAVNGTQRLLVYEYLAGGDVSRRLQKCARDGLPFSYQQRLSAALDAACGLSHLHNANPKVYHRDIKTANILLDRNGGAKMADFGLACLSRSNEHKVKQASGTIGYACPYYIQRGVVTEGSEVYSFGMVLIEFLCNAPPACAGQNPGEILYLVNHLQGSVSRCVNMADPKANWPPFLANKLAELAMNCVSMNETSRPKFVQIVKALRHMNEMAIRGDMPQSVEKPLSPKSPSATKRQSKAPVSPPVRQLSAPVSPSVDLIRLECIYALVPIGPGSVIVHTCSEDDGSLPSLKVGRHVQSSIFDSLVPTDTLKGTISREHFVISFQPVTRSQERQFHATLTNNSINSVNVNERALEKGQSSFIYSGDKISFLALLPNSSSPCPFLTFKVEIVNPLIQANRPKPAGPAAAASSIHASIGSANSLPACNEDDRVSPPHSSDDLMNITHCAYQQDSLKRPESRQEASSPSRAIPPPIPPPVFIQPSALVPPVAVSSSIEKAPPPVPQPSAFYFMVKDRPIIESLSVKEPSAVLRVGRSFQPESFWRDIAPDACPAISREHFSVSAMRPRSGSVCEEMMLGMPVPPSKAGYRFFLNCNSMNGLAVLNPPSSSSCSVGTQVPVFLQKDSPGASNFEIFDGSQIEMAGSIRLVFRETLNTNPSLMSGSTAATTSAARSIHFAPASVLKPPLTAYVQKGSAVASASASFIGDDEESPDDAFYKTGFRPAAAGQ